MKLMHNNTTSLISMESEKIEYTKDMSQNTLLNALIRCFRLTQEDKQVMIDFVKYSYIIHTLHNTHYSIKDQYCQEFVKKLAENQYYVENLGKFSKIIAREYLNTVVKELKILSDNPLVSKLMLQLNIIYHLHLVIIT